MDFQVKLDLEDDILTARIEINTPAPGDEYYFYLLRYGKVVEKIGWRDLPVYDFKLAQNGIYAIQAHVKRKMHNKFKKSDPVFFCSAEDARKFDNLCDNHLKIDVGLDFYTTKFPYQDFSVIFTGDDSSHTRNKLSKFIEEGMNFRTLFDVSERKCHILSTRKINKSEKYSYIFSGIARNDNKLFLGDEDLENDSDIEYIFGSLGNFSAIISDGKKVNILTDYFGTSKIYFFENDNLFVASNRYHLLLLTISDLGIALEPNQEKIVANLAFENIQQFVQNFTREMEVLNVQVMPIDKRISLSAAGVLFENGQIFSDLHSAENFDHEQYKDLLNKAAAEVIDNVRVALQHPSFDYVLCDLSGGMDSRMVYAAMTNLPQYRDKVRIASYELASVPEELRTAIAVNNLYGYKFNDLPECHGANDHETIAAQIGSLYLGTYYSYKSPDKRRKIPRTIRLTGMYGEITLRPYYARKYLGSDVDVDSIEEFVEGYFSKHANMAIIDEQTLGLSTIKRLFKAELECIPGQRALEKFDLHYLFYRCGLHCSDTWRTDLSVPEWGPLQSKTLFKLKTSTFHLFPLIKLQLDMLRILNPLVAALPFEGAQDNEDKKSLRDELLVLDNMYDNFSILPNFDDRAWLLAKSEKSTKISFAKELSEKIIPKNPQGSLGATLLDKTLNALIYLAKYQPEVMPKKLALQIYIRLQEKALANSFHYLANKILSLFYQVKILERN